MRLTCRGLQLMFLLPMYSRFRFGEGSHGPKDGTSLDGDWADRSGDTRNGFRGTQNSYED